MLDLKLEVGKKYNIQFMTSNLDNVIASEFVKEFNGGIVLFDNNGCPLLANKEFDIISEYTEPKKLSGWINVFESDIELTREKADKQAQEFVKFNNKRIACIDLSKFNVGEGL
jgi:sensor domain CHASE-containing protein